MKSSRRSCVSGPFCSSFLLLFALCAGLSCKLAAQPASEPLAKFWRADGVVNAIVVTNNVAYLGGDFGYLGPASGAAGLLDADFGDPLPGFPKLDGIVNTVISDGAGGWYVGGKFIPAAAPKLQNLVHVRADNSLDTEFKPNPDSTVRSLALVGGTLLAGGEFFQVADAQVGNLALIDLSTGKTNGVRLRVNGVVSAMAVSGDTVYLGGQINGLTAFQNGQQVNVPRQRLAAITPGTGAVLDWNPTCLGGFEGVKAITISGSTIYVGGDFTQCGGKPRNGIASLNSTDGTANNWNPNAQLSGGTAVINALAVVGNVVYAGGDFTTIGARPRTRLAALQAGSFGQADANWQADANDIVTLIVPIGTDILVGGRFTVIGGKIDVVNFQPIQTGGTSRRGFARIAQATAAVSDWGPQVSTLKSAQFGVQANATAFTLGMQGSQMLLAGDFFSFGGVNRSRIAALDLSTGAVTPWNPNADLTVRALALGRSGLYVGGSFTNIGGLMRPRLALVKYDTGLADPWDARFVAGQFVSTIAVGRGSVFVGGQFVKIGGQDRPNLAELDAATGDATGWNPQPGGPINALVVTDTQIYVGGAFFGISGGQQQYLALLNQNVDAARQLVATFQPQPDWVVRTLMLSGNLLFAGGDFTKISGQDRKAVAAIDAQSGQETNPLDGQVTGQGQQQVRAVIPLGQALYLGGQFRGAGGENRGRIASINPSFGAASGWDPGADAPINAIANTDKVILIGGEFTRLGLRGPNPNPSVDGQPVPFLAAFDARPSIQNFHKNAAGHYVFDVLDGDGLGSSLLIQSSETLNNPTWQTLKTLDILGLQDPFEELTPAPGGTRFFRLLRQP